MGKMLKISLYGLIGITLFVIIAVICLPFIVDPNDFKAEITSAVKQHTGRELAIEGDLKLSVFPWLGLSTGKLALSNADNFPDKNFAEIGESQIKVKLVPLFSKQVEVSRIVLKGLTLNLAKNKQGQNNWDDLLAAKTEEKAATPDANKPEEDDKKASSPASALALFTIGGISIEQARLIWDDQQAGKRTEIKNLDLITDQFVFNQAINVKLAFQIINNQPSLTEDLQLNTQLVINDQLNQFTLNQLHISSKTQGDNIPTGAISAVLSADSIIDLSTELVDIKNLKLSIDDSTLSGNSQIRQFKQPSIQFNLALDKLDLDHYLPPKDKDEAKGDKTKVIASPAAAVASTATLFPVETLRALNIDGNFQIGQLKANGLSMQGLSLQLNAKNGKISTKHDIKQFYQGSYQGAASVNATKSRPAISLNEQLVNVQAEPFLTDLNGSSRITGALNASAALQASGNTVPALKSSLTGKIDFKFSDGVVKGINIQQTIDTAKTLLTGSQILRDNPNDQTVFSVIKGTANARNGVLHNDDLFLASSKIQLFGKGTADLVGNKIDYQLDVKKVKNKATETQPAELKDLPVALKVYGALDSPTITPVISDSKKDQLIEKLDKKLKLEEKLPGATELLKSFF